MIETPAATEPLAPQQAQERIAAIRGDQAHPFNHAGHREHARAVEEVNGLYRRVYGTAEVERFDDEPPASAAPPPAVAAAPPASGDEGAPAPPAAPSVPEALEWHPAVAGAYFETADDLGVSHDVASGLLDYAAQRMTEEIPDPETALASLRAEWGGDFSARLAAARLVVERLPAPIRADLDATGLGDDPGLIRRLAEIGAPLYAAQRELAGIRKDPRHPANDVNHPKHAAAVEAKTQLYRRLYGTREA